MIIHTALAVHHPLVLQLARSQKADAISLNSAHTGFDNVDRITALVQRLKRLHYPDGQGIRGVRRMREIEQASNSVDGHYVQKIIDDEEVGLMIVCLFREQAELLVQATVLEIDMSFKRVVTSGLNEIIVAYKHTKAGRSQFKQRLITIHLR